MFEKGKWYYDKLNKYYIKYLKSEFRTDVNKDVIFYTDFVNPKYSSSIQYKSYPQGSTGVGYISNSWVLIEDLSEIQQYLPKDHPDKIQNNSEFKVGEYLYFTENKNFSAREGSIAKVVSNKTDSEDNFYKNKGIDVKWIIQKNNLGNITKVSQQNGIYYQKNFRKAKLSKPESIVQNLVYAKTAVLQAEVNLNAAKEAESELKEMYNFLEETQKELF